MVCSCNHTSTSKKARIGKGTKVYPFVYIGDNVVIGKNCKIYPHAVIYNNVKIGDNCIVGNHASVREWCVIGNNTQIGQKVGVECCTNIGNNVSIESQSHITGWMTIEDCVFVGGFIGSTNDMKMSWKRKGHGENLRGATLKYGCRIGSGSLLLPAVVIGKHSIVNAGEIVRKDIPDNTLFFTKKGKPIFKKIKEDKLRV